MNKKVLTMIQNLSDGFYALQEDLYIKKVIHHPFNGFMPTCSDYPISLKVLEIGIHDLNTKFYLLLEHLGLEYDELPARAVIQKKERKGP